MGRGGRNHSKPTGNAQSTHEKPRTMPGGLDDLVASSHDASTALPPKPATECKEIDRREGKCKPLKGKAPKVPVKPSEPTLDSKAEAQRDCAERLSSVSELERRKEKGKGRETEAADHDRNGVRKRTVDCAVSSTNANSSRTPSEPLPSQNQTTKRFTSLGVVVSCPTSVLNVGDPKPIVAANVQAGPSHDSVKDTAEASPPDVKAPSRRAPKKAKSTIESDKRTPTGAAKLPENADNGTSAISSTAAPKQSVQSPTVKLPPPEVSVTTRQSTTAADIASSSMPRTSTDAKKTKARPRGQKEQSNADSHSLSAAPIKAPRTESTPVPATRALPSCTTTPKESTSSAPSKEKMKPRSSGQQQNSSGTVLSTAAPMKPVVTEPKPAPIAPPPSKSAPIPSQRATSTPSHSAEKVTPPDASTTETSTQPNKPKKAGRKVAHAKEGPVEAPPAIPQQESKGVSAAPAVPTPGHTEKATYVDRFGHHHELVVNIPAADIRATDQIAQAASQTGDETTEVCQNYLRGRCKWRARCLRIHPPDVEVPQPDEVCRMYLSGKCPWGAQCDRIHPRDVEVPRPDQVCRLYLRGRCRAGRSCFYLHPPRDNRSDAAENGSVISETDNDHSSAEGFMEVSRATSDTTDDGLTSSLQTSGRMSPVNWDVEADYSAWKLDTDYSGDTSESSIMVEPSHLRYDKPTGHAQPSYNRLRLAIPSKICRDWVRGSCKRGNLCQYQHDKAFLEAHSLQAASISPIGVDDAASELSRPITSPTRSYPQNPVHPPGLPIPPHLQPKNEPEGLGSEAPPPSLPIYPTRYFSVQDHAKVKLGPGFEILEILTGFESRWVVLGNVRHSVTEAAIRDLLDPYGCVIEVKMPPAKVGRASIMVKAQFSTPAEALYAATQLNGAYVFKDTITARLPPNNFNKGSAVLHDSSVRLTWEAPHQVLYAGYDTLAEAEAMVHARAGLEMNGLVISARHYEGTPGVGMYNVRFDGLPPDMKHADMKDWAQVKGLVDVMFSRAKYASVHLAAQGIHHAAKRFGGLQTFRVLPPPYKDGMVTAWADFSTPNDARIASNSLHGRGVPALGKAVLSAQYQATISYTVPGTVYDKLASDIFFLKGTCWRQRLRSSVHVTDPRRVEATAGVRIKLAADNLSSLAPLKIAFEKILHGERVTDNGKAAWHPFLATDDGALFIEELERLHPGVWIEARRSTRTIILFGHIRLRRHVRSALLAKIGRLHAQQIRYIRLSSRDVEYFVRGGLAKLQEIFGPENVFLRLLDRSLGVRGSDATYEPVAKAVRETQLQHSEARPSSTIECPVCFDEPVCPITMRCGHVWCGLCMSNYLISANENRQFPLTCLGGGATCKEPLPLRVAQDILSASDFDAVVNAAFTSFINSRPEEFYHCPTPDCPQIYREVTDVILQCPSCLVRICSECHVEAHDGLDCEDRDRNDKLFQAWLESNDVKSCPGCKAPIEKSDGCNHMTCTRCKTHICWKCMATFPKGDGIYDHMRNEHGGIWD